MARLVSKRSKQGFLGVFWNQFTSLDPFTRMFLVIAILIVGATPYIINNYQTYMQHAQGNGNTGSPKDTVTIAPNSSLVFGGHVYFQVSGPNVTAANNYLYVYNTCMQNGAVVYAQYQTVPSTGLTPVFTLGPTPSWSSGGANCSATPEVFNSNKGAFKTSGQSVSYTVTP